MTDTAKNVSAIQFIIEKTQNKVSPLLIYNHIYISSPRFFSKNHTLSKVHVLSRAIDRFENKREREGEGVAKLLSFVFDILRQQEHELSSVY